MQQLKTMLKKKTKQTWYKDFHMIICPNIQYKWKHCSIGKDLSVEKPF